MNTRVRQANARVRQARRYSEPRDGSGVDQPLLLAVLGLMAIGVVMVASTSVAVAEKYAVGDWHFFIRHLMFIGVGGLLAFAAWLVPSELVEKCGRPSLLLALVLLGAVMLPGLGWTVNGATRWINLGFFRFQVVEAVKLLMIIYVAGYLAKRPALGQAGLMDTLKPLLIGALMAVILLKQPDMGSAVVLMAILGGMVWLAGAAWKSLSLMGVLALPVVTFAAMEPYRLRRLTSFADPFADPYGAGFQMVQALIAIGRGEIAGVGIGGSVQKLFYLPEAHTDFIFAILAEEMGLIGIAAVLALFGVLVGRIFRIGLRAMGAERPRPFAAYLAFGVGLWVGLQALVSIGVNLGMLPTKGLTLPLVSSGGSSMLMVMLALGMVLRLGREIEEAERGRPRRGREWAV